jgi:hypothetical protein
MSDSKAVVFVSYVSKDAGVVKRLKERLVAATDGALAFFYAGDGESIPPGSDWNKTIREALHSADAVLVLISQHSEYSQWVPFEVGYALADDKPIVPILSPGSPPSRNSPLDHMQQIEIRSADSLVQVVKRLGSLIGKELPAKFEPHDVEYIFGYRPPDLYAVSLLSRDEIYREITRVVKASEKDARIRATSTFIDPYWDADPVFDQYIETIAEKIRDSKLQGGEADYTLVMSFKIDEHGMPTQDLQQSMRNRQAAFEKVDACDRIIIYRREEHWRIEVFILGESDAVLAFPLSSDSSKLAHGVRVYGRDFVMLVAHWFETCLMAGAALVNPTTLRVHKVPEFSLKSAEGIDPLYSLVSGAIWHAEQLAEHQDAFSDAWEEVSLLEEGLATALPVSSPEGLIARRGAVRAAMKARDHARARLLTRRYLADEEAPDSLRAELCEILEADATE